MNGERPTTTERTILVVGLVNRLLRDGNAVNVDALLCREGERKVAAKGLVASVRGLEVAEFD